MKSLCRIALPLCASLCVAFFVSSCALGLEPAKSSSGTTVSLHLSSLASAVTGRAIIQGSGYLYIQTGSTAADAKLYGPWQTGSGELFTTSEVPSGSYDSFTIVYLDTPALTSPVAVDTDHPTILGALQNRLSDLPDTLSSCSCATLSDVIIRSNRDNPIEATLVPATTTTPIDVSLASLSGIPAATSGIARRFFKLTNIEVISTTEIGKLIYGLSFGLTASVTPLTVSRMALYSLSGKLISASNNATTLASGANAQWFLSYPATGDSSCYLYLEYQGTPDPVSSMVVQDNSYSSRGTWYVSNAGGSDGSDASHPCTLAQAVACINKSTYSGTQTLFLTGDVTMSSASAFTLEQDTLLTSAGSTPHTIKAGSSSATVSFTVGSTAAAAVTFSNCIVDGAGYAADHLVSVANGTFTLASGATLQNSVSSSSGGGVYVSGINAAFVIDGGTISSCSAGTSGGAVYITSSGACIMSKGTITGCTALNGGAVGMSGGIFKMFGGIIANCSNSAASGVGGGVYISGGASMTLNGGTISGCTSQQQGGGVYTSTGSSLVLKSGSIAGCEATNSSISGNGGGVYISGGSLTIDGGSISSCASDSAGGGVAIMDSGSMTMDGGSIESCKTTSISTGTGGGIYNGNGSLTLNGGKISTCDSNYGGGVYSYQSSVSFAANTASVLTFTGNAASSSPNGNNFYKDTGTSVSVGGSGVASYPAFLTATGYGSWSAATSASPGMCDLFWY